MTDTNRTNDGRSEGPRAGHKLAEVAQLTEDEAPRRVPAGDPIALTARERPRAAMTETASGTKVAILISGPKSVDPGFVPSGATATFWVGAFDDSGAAPVGVANENLDIIVTRPDGSTESFSKTTDSQGQATISYDTSQSRRGDGKYSAEVQDADNTSTDATARMTVGLDIVSTTVRFNDFVFNGEQSTYAFLAHDGESPVSGESLTL